MGLFQVVRRDGNALDLRNPDSNERKANIADVVLVRNLPEGLRMHPYQVLRSPLHQYAVVTPPHQLDVVAKDLDTPITDDFLSPVSPWDSAFEAVSESDTEESGVPARILQPRRVRFLEPPAGGEVLDIRLPNKDKMKRMRRWCRRSTRSQFVSRASSCSTSATASRHGSAIEHNTRTSVQEAEAAMVTRSDAQKRPARVADRICDVAVREQLLYVRIVIEASQIVTTTRLVFLRRFAEPDERNWLRRFVRENVAGIKDSGWKSLLGSG